MRGAGILEAVVIQVGPHTRVLVATHRCARLLHLSAAIGGFTNSLRGLRRVPAQLSRTGDDAVCNRAAHEASHRKG